ncbi:MAG: hypothetical protein M1431_05450 [Candidatus Thermoplasmatota archaeon]|nr:hypothetical protein [Candidatus Thermoplasmatota archaeon]
MPSIDCSLSVAPETKEGDSFLKVVAGLVMILVYNGLRISLRRFRAKISVIMKDKR